MLKKKVILLLLPNSGNSTFRTTDGMSNTATRNNSYATNFHNLIYRRNQKHLTELVEHWSNY